MKIIDGKELVNMQFVETEDDVEKFIKEVGVEAIEKFMFGVYR